MRLQSPKGYQIGCDGADAPGPRTAAQVARADLKKRSRRFANFDIVKRIDDDGNERAETIGLASEAIARRLFQATGGWPKRVGGLLFARQDDRPIYLERTDDAFAWIGRSLPRVKERHPVRWANGQDRPTKSEFDRHLRQTAEAYAAVEAFPHQPAMPDTYYLHPTVRGGDGVALSGLVDRFAPATEVDRQLVLALFMTLVAGLPPGSRPAFLLTAADGDAQAGRGVGKSTLAKVAAQLFGGEVQVDQRDDMAALKTRLLSPDGRGKRVLLLDNIKSLKFSWDQLEGLITSAVISGRQLYVGEGRLPNTLTTILTLNGPALSKDLAQRCVVVKLRRPTFSADWEEGTRRYVEQNRWAIVGDLVARLKADAPPLTAHSRWGSWEGAVLARVEDAEECQAEVVRRQAEIDDDESDSEMVRDAFARVLADRGCDPDTSIVFIPAADAAAVLEAATQEKLPTSKASSRLRTLCIPELSKSNRGADRGGRGWTWRGLKATAGARGVILPAPRPYDDREWPRAA